MQKTSAHPRLIHTSSPTSLNYQVQLYCYGAAEERIAGVGELDLGAVLGAISERVKVEGEADVWLNAPSDAPASSPAKLRFRLRLTYEGQRRPQSRLPVSARRMPPRVGEDDDGESVASGNTETLGVDRRAFRNPDRNADDRTEDTEDERDEEEATGDATMPQNAYSESLNVPKGARKFTCAVDLRSIKRHKSVPHSLAVRCRPRGL